MQTRHMWRGAALLLILSVAVAAAAAQVSQERQHTIRQSGSGAPAVSVTSDDRAVSAERQVRTTDGQRVVQRRVDQTDGSSATVQQDGGDGLVSVTGVPDEPRMRIRGGPEPGVNPAGSAAAERNVQWWMHRNDPTTTVVPPNDDPSIQSEREQMRMERERAQQEQVRQERRNVQREQARRERQELRREQEQAREDRRVDRRVRNETVRREAERAAVDVGRGGSATISQRARASGDNAKIVQRIIIVVEDQLDSALSRVSRLGSTTRAESGDAAAQQTANVNRDGTMQMDAEAASSDGSASTEQRIQLQRSDGDRTREVTVRSAESASGQGAAVSQQVRAPRDTQRQTAQRRMTGQTDTQGCTVHTHRHGNGDHHDSFHIGSHTHQHRHC